MNQMSKITGYGDRRGILSTLEIPILIAAIIDEIEQVGDPAKGSCLFRTREDGEDAQTLFRFRLRDGAYEYRPPKSGKRSSDRDNIDSIEEALSFPHDSVFTELPELSDFDNLPSGIWQYGYYRVVSIHATGRQFYGAFKADLGEEDRRNTVRVLYAAAKTLACLRFDDRELQDSARLIYAAEKRISYKISETNSRIDEMFARCELPELKKWRDSLSIDDQSKLESSLFKFD